MKYLFMPLNQHFDDGFGATGEAFARSAKVLMSSPNDVSYHLQIPLCFLYRHAIELYLKSAIVVLHRALAIPYDKNPHDGPAFVLVNKKWKPIYQVHSVAELWGHVLYLVRSSKSELERRCKTDWQAVPPDLIRSIEEIERIDGRSTFFRYPDFQRPDVDQEKAMMLLMIDQNDQVTQGFQYDDKTLAEVLELLKNTADTLSGLHLGLRMELAGRIVNGYLCVSLNTSASKSIPKGMFEEWQELPRDKLVSKGIGTEQVEDVIRVGLFLYHATN